MYGISQNLTGTRSLYLLCLSLKLLFLYFFHHYNSLTILSHALFLFFIAPSLSACLCIISMSLFLPCLSFSCILSLSPSLQFCVSPRGHWGQAWCHGQVDKYHVSLFRAFSGRVTVYLLLELHHGAAFLSETLWNYIYIFNMLNGFLCFSLQVCRGRTYKI